MKTLEFLFPKVLSEANTEKYLRVINAMREGAKKIRLNFRETEEVTPSGIAMLLALHDVAYEQEIKIDSVFIKKKFKQFPIFQKLEKLRPGAIEEIERFNYNGDEVQYSSVEGSFSIDTLTSYTAKISKSFARSTQEILTELIQNSIDHSSSERFHYFLGEDENELSMGVLDLGVSIPSKLEQKYLQSSDTDYIESSFKKDVSTRRLRSGGHGLAETMELIKKLDGRVAVLSRKGQVRRYFKNRRIDRKELKFNLPGTWTFVTIPKK